MLFDIIDIDNELFNYLINTGTFNNIDNTSFNLHQSLLIKTIKTDTTDVIIDNIPFVWYNLITQTNVNIE